MSFDLIILSVLGAMVLLLMHLRSHIIFVALGGFVGLVMGNLFLEFGDQFVSMNAAWQDYLEVALFVLPAFILGINHYKTRRKIGLIHSLLMAVLTTAFLVANFVYLLPQSLNQTLLDSSFLLSQLSYFRLYITLAMIVALLLNRSAFSNKLLSRKRR